MIMARPKINPTRRIVFIVLYVTVCNTAIEQQPGGSLGRFVSGRRLGWCQNRRSIRQRLDAYTFHHLYHDDGSGNGGSSGGAGRADRGDSGASVDIDSTPTLDWMPSSKQQQQQQGTDKDNDEKECVNNHPDWLLLNTSLRINCGSQISDHTTRATESAVPVLELRGGGHPSKKPSSAVREANILDGSKATLASAAEYWSNAVKGAAAKMSQPFRAAKDKIKVRFRSKEEKEEAWLIEQLQTMPVQRVEVVNSDVLPPEVVQMAARRSGLLGQPLRSDRVQDFARTVKSWYDRKGYVLHGVTGATLQADTATAEIAVQEPTISAAPVEITFCKEMVVHPGTGELMTFRAFQEKHSQRRSVGGLSKLTRQQLNTTFVETTGRTRPGRLAEALELHPGRPFQWKGDRWQRIKASGIFKQVLRASPERLPDGSVQLHIYATEAPPRHLEYGVGKSLYTGAWEGEVDFEHSNLLGGGERFGLSVRRGGTKDAQPSARVKFTNDRFGLGGGYDIEVFGDALSAKDMSLAQITAATASTSKASSAAPSASYAEEETGPNLDASKRESSSVAEPSSDISGIAGTLVGATFRIRNPIDPRQLSNSAASVSLERTGASSGYSENMGSATLTVGPVTKELPLGARSNVDATVTAGARLADAAIITKQSTDSDSRGSHNILGYTAITATTRQIFPLFASANSLTTASGTTATMGRPVLLALKHSAMTSTRHLPWHQARAQGMSCGIRGATINGRISTAVKGTTELRVPVPLPPRIPTPQDAIVVLFGDWLFATQDAESPFVRKSSIGLGFRKSIQGIPVQCDVCYNPSENKIKTAFGLGTDFDV